MSEQKKRLALRLSVSANLPNSITLATIIHDITDMRLELYG